MKKSFLFIFLALLSLYLVACDTTPEEQIPNVYTITFNTDGGSSISSIEIEEGELLTKPNDPTKKDHDFKGWFEDSAKTKAFNFQTPITQNITIYAKWEETTAAAKINIYLVGDSTVSSFTDPYYMPRYGYGTKVDTYMNTDVTVINLALSGRSSKSFLKEENYQTLLKELSEGDYLIIGFSHNDQKNEVDRYTNPNTDTEDSGSFKYHLYEYYIKVAQEKGAIPILATPIVRRSTSNNYTGNSGHITSDQGADYPGGNYPEAIRELGAEKDVTVIDLTELTKELYTTLGQDKTFDLHAQTTDNPNSVDNTHLSEYGASYIAYLLTQEFNKVPILKDYVLSNSQIPNKEAFGPNPDYQPTEYETGFTPSDIWTSLPNDWFGTVFGDVGGNKNINTDVYKLEETEGNFILQAAVNGSNSGKIAGSTDGIGMIFQEIDGTKDFEFSATMTVLNYASNSQVAFGLMIRDEIFIDTSDNSIGSDYVAAGIIDTTGSNAFSGRISSKVTKNATDAFTLVEELTIELSIIRVNGTYSIKVGDYTNEVELDLSVIDEEKDYIGMFVSRNAKVSFTNVTLTIEE